MINNAMRIVFTGRVQGVGFRYTACRIARTLMLTGFVKNLHDGSVEMFVQGPEEDISRCLAEIHSEFQGYITDTKTTSMTLNPSYTSFQITF